MSKDSLGRPDDNNRTVTENMIKEQWVYRSRELYLYFDDGILTAWQD